MIKHAITVVICGFRYETMAPLSLSAKDVIDAVISSARIKLLQGETFDNYIISTNLVGRSVRIDPNRGLYTFFAGDGPFELWFFDPSTAIDIIQPNGKDSES